MHVPVGAHAVVQAVQLDVGVDVGHRVRADVVGGHLGPRDLLGYPDGPGARGGHGVGDRDPASDGAEEHDADVAVERHLLVEEYGSLDLTGAVD